MGPQSRRLKMRVRHFEPTVRRKVWTSHVVVLVLDALAVRTEGPRQSVELPDHIRFSESIKDTWFVSSYMRCEAVHQISAPEETVDMHVCHL